MALTLSGTNGVVGAGFTVDNSGVSVTAGVGTFSSIRGTHHGDGANLTSLPAAQLTGTLPALSAASLTQIPAANIVGVCTAGLGGAAGAFGNVKITRVGQGSLNGVDSYTYTSFPSGIVEFSYQWYGASLSSNEGMVFRIGGGGGGTSTSGYYVAQAEIGDGTDSVTRSPRTSEIPVNTDSWEASPGVSSGRIDFTQAEGNLWTWKMQNYYYATSSGHYVNMLNTGYITIGGTLERAVLFSTSGANFDAGYVYLTYKQLL
tara:strand:+ start:841 stop:1620 length:780 start_codon:yes stop_codon:yes gene_type:complete